jgi:hypothetical protein
MTRRVFWRSLAVVALLAFSGFAAKLSFAGSISVVSGTITSGTVQYVPVSGTAPNGNTWASYMSGTSPVSYFVVPGPNDVVAGSKLGTLMFDPKGKNASTVDYRYGYFGTIGSGTAGPYVYTTGTGNPGSVSTSVIDRTMPAGVWSNITTFPARLSGAVSLTNTPTLTTSGNNIASTSGWFDLPWSFGAVAPTVTQSLMFSSTAGQGFRAVSSVNNAAPVNLLGYGNGIGMFLWLEAGVGGNQYGAVIPVQAVPEPSSFVLAGLGIVAGGIQLRRQLRRSRPMTSPSAQ